MDDTEVMEIIDVMEGMYVMDGMHGMEGMDGGYLATEGIDLAKEGMHSNCLTFIMTDMKTDHVMTEDDKDDVKDDKDDVEEDDAYVADFEQVVALTTKSDLDSKPDGNLMKIKHCFAGAMAITEITGFLQTMKTEMQGTEETEVMDDMQRLMSCLSDMVHGPYPHPFSTDHLDQTDPEHTITYLTENFVDVALKMPSEVVTLTFECLYHHENLRTTMIHFEIIINIMTILLINYNNELN
jgi:hypothetical protein